MKLGVGCHVVLQEIHNEVSCFGGGAWGTWGTTLDKVAQFDLPSWWAEVHGVLGVLLFGSSIYSVVFPRSLAQNLTTFQILYHIYHIYLLFHPSKKKLKKIILENRIL
jgi:hypothetical protein